MALDLAQDDDMLVTVVDKRPEALEKIASSNPQVAIVKADLSSPQAVTALVSRFDLVLSAVPGSMGFETLKAVIAAGKTVVDIAFFPENPFDLDDLAKDKGITAPEIREWPYEYKAGFSPIDVIEQYTRPARYVENGHVVVRPALTDPEFIDFPKVGTLEAFNTDGLRTLAHTIDAPKLKEKTLRYPGHIEKMLVLRETGFFDREPLEIGGSSIRPIDFTTKLLFPKWKLEQGDVDITVLRVIVEGEADGTPTRYTYELYDRYDERTGVHSMARTTGYTATVAVRLLAAGLYTTPGITPPEFLGRYDACVRFLLDGLKQRGVEFKETVDS
jgi:saccharopine dehydrogenase-like NADP-dependent oxidoreductase